MKKILIIYGTAGEGHKRAAVAIKTAFDILKPDESEIKLIDALDYTNKFFKWLYPRMYIFMVTYIPTIWGFFYYLLDWRLVYPVVRFIRRVINKMNTGRLEEFLCNCNPDIIIATHFLTSEVVSDLKRRGRLKAELITCVTDFGMHSFWFAKETDFFCVGFKETMDDLTNKWGFDGRKINITGIPVSPKFYDVKIKEELCNKLNISKGLFTILITGGGFGVGPIMGIVQALIKMKERLQILIVCGHNENLKMKIDKLSAFNSKLSAVIKTYGFIDYVDELMTVSDLAVTKAGGLICSEALAKELPLIIISPIPGQETRNCKLLLRNNAAFRANRPGQVRKIIRKIHRSDNMLNVMKENIRRIRKQDPAATIAKFVISVERV